jgi:D-3-phosphoglycerate dehydrogenase
MARLARAIGMEVVAWTFHPSAERAAEIGGEFLPLEEVLRTSDVVSIHVRLSPRTEGLIGAKEFALMKPGAILVNGARGAIVDHGALVEALESGRLAGAGLDVFPQEPLPADDPILRCDQVVLTPHVADATPEAVEMLNTGVVENVLAFIAGDPTNNRAS